MAQLLDHSRRDWPKFMWFCRVLVFIIIIINYNNLPVSVLNMCRCCCPFFAEVVWVCVRLCGSTAMQPFSAPPLQYYIVFTIFPFAHVDMIMCCDLCCGKMCVCEHHVCSPGQNYDIGQDLWREPSFLGAHTGLTGSSRGYRLVRCFFLFYFFRFFVFPMLVDLVTVLRWPD